MERTDRIYRGPYILMNHPDGTQRLTPARKTEHGVWVPLTPQEVEAQKS